METEQEPEEVVYSVIIPAFNEEKLLPATLDALSSIIKELELPAELIVVDNNSTDDTPEIAAKYGATVVFEKINQISRARNAGARVAKGGHLFFIDADTIVSRNLILKALNNLQENNYCGGGVQVHLQSEVHGIVQWTLDLWNMISRRLHLAAGCFIYCRRDAFNSINGFSEEVYASEEIWFSRALKKWGKSKGMLFGIIPDESVHTSARKMEWYTLHRLIFFTLPILIFPPVVRYKFFCKLWYQRPE